jgi:hypothetical protein
MRILLVEPEFPIPPEGKNHKNYLPVGLLKLAALYKARGDFTQLARGNLPLNEIDFEPDQVCITSLFTYWRDYVKQSVRHYRNLFPRAMISVGGIYASLMPEDCKVYTGCDKVCIGVNDEAENFLPDYSSLSDPKKMNFQIMHTTRGCIRSCKFCGVSQIEPRFTYKESIKKEIFTNRLVFYDNNMLAHPHITRILTEIAETKFKGRHVVCESQCGFDGRLITQEVAQLLKKARFRNVRIAWDGPYSEFKEISRQIKTLSKAGYKTREIFIFMIYNWEISFEEMEKKRKKCKKWGVQIADCRYRPLDQLYDHYKPLKKQTNKDYYIHPKWTDVLVKKFRRNVRVQNICVRMGFARYDSKKEHEGEAKRKVRKALIKPLQDSGYNVTRVRQVYITNEKYTAHCLLPNREIVVEGSNSLGVLRIERISERPVNSQKIIPMTQKGGFAGDISISVKNTSQTT